MAGEPQINGTQAMLSAVTTTVTGTAYAPNNAAYGASNKDGIFQIDIASGTATVVLEGRVVDTADWVTLATLSADGASQIVTLYPLMRARVSAISGATVSAWLNC